MLKGKPKLRGASDFEVIPEGLYTVQIVDVNEATWEYKGNEKTGFVYKFVILDEEELPETGESTRGRFLWWRVSDSIDKRSKLHKLAAAALKRKLTDKEQDTNSKHCFDPESIIGMQVMVTVENNESDGRTWNNVAGATRVKEELEPVDYQPKEDTTTKTKTRSALDEDDEEEDEDDGKNIKLPNLMPALDKIVKDDEDDEDDEDEDEEESPKKSSKKSSKKDDDEDDDEDDEEEEDEDDEDDEDEVAELERAAEAARKRLEKAKAAKSGKGKVTLKKK